MFYFQNKNLSEGADTLTISERTLKARLHRGRELLRKKFGHMKSPLAGNDVEE